MNVRVRSGHVGRMADIPSPVMRGPTSTADGSDRDERFREVYRAEVAALIGYAARRVARAEDAADIVADVFLVAWRRIDELPAGREARLWLFGVARNVLSNYHRGARRRQKLATRMRGELSTMLESTMSHVADTHAVSDALERMPVELRELLVLTAWEGLAPHEIALVLNLPAGTVRSRLHRARHVLRAELAAESKAANAQVGERWGRIGHVGGRQGQLAADCEER